MQSPTTATPGLLLGALAPYSTGRLYCSLDFELRALISTLSLISSFLSLRRLSLLMGKMRCWVYLTQKAFSLPCLEVMAMY